ncbi:MAG TPA: substrate-binding domain-containing protein [Verrucomicrobiae bacterium]
MNLIPQRSSLVAQTVLILKDGIRAGLWNGFLPGEMALCHRLQVSRVTLRAALEQLQREHWCSAGQGRRRKIHFDRARHTGPSASDRVVLLSPLPLQNLPASALFWVDALREHLATVGYRLEFQHAPSVYSQHPERALESVVHKSRAASWVLYLSTHALQQWFSERGLPCVICGSRHADVQLSSVDIDYAATCGHATGLLVGRGRRRLALLMPRSEQAGNIESEQGFLKAVERHPGVKGQVAHHDGTTTGICGALDRLLRGEWAINGLLVAKPAHVVTAVSHLLRRGVRLPQDVSLLSRDDDPLLEHLVPVVSRYHVEPEAFARRVSRLVVDLARTGAQRQHDSRIIPSLIRGETLG